MRCHRQQLAAVAAIPAVLRECSHIVETKQRNELSVRVAKSGLGALHAGSTSFLA